MARDNLHFISGLPRAGSTLLAAILHQNPKCHAGMSSPLGFLYTSMLEAVSEKNEFAIFIPREKKPAFLRSVFEIYYQEKFAAGQIVFDTNRLWCAKLAGLTRSRRPGRRLPIRAEGRCSRCREPYHDQHYTYRNRAPPLRSSRMRLQIVAVS